MCRVLRNDILACWMPYKLDGDQSFYKVVHDPFENEHIENVSFGLALTQDWVVCPSISHFPDREH